MALDPQTLYHQIGRLVETMPNHDLKAYPLSPEAHRWLGQGDALVKASGDLRDTVDWRNAVEKLGTEVFHKQAEEELRRVLYRALGAAELKAPPSTKGTFIPVGSGFDAFAAIAKILQGAKRDVFIVDPYMDETALTEFGLAVPTGVALRLLADGKDHKPTLAPAAQKWSAQYGSTRPLSVRLAPPRTLHDRAIFIDGAGAWTLTQSLKDFAKRSPGEIIRADDTAALKIAAYENVWAEAPVVV
jgi:hypothetical protein